MISLVCTIFAILVSIANLYLDFINTKQFMTMFQQNAYYYKNYQTWIKNNYYKIFANYFVLDVICVAAVFLNLGLLLTVLVINLIIKIFAIIFKLRIISRTQRIKLAYTARIKRLITTVVALQVIIIIVLATIFSSYSLKTQVIESSVVALISVLLPWIIMLANVINSPIESKVRNYYINDAKNIVKDFSGEVIGLTGSYGKTTTKNFVNTILSENYFVYQTPASYNSTMGITISIRNDLKSIHDIFLVELGAKQNNDLDDVMELTNPDIAILSSIGPQHLETFKSIENVINTKFAIVEQLKAGGKAFLNVDNSYIRNYEIKNQNVDIITYGVDNNDADYQVVNINQNPHGSTFDVTYKGSKINELPFETKVLGKLNLLNICVAIAIANEKNMPIRKIALGVKKIVAPEHRLQIKNQGKYIMIDDAYNSNPVGSKEALNVLSQFDGRRVVVTPGMIELGSEQSKLNEAFGFHMYGKTDYIILVGRKITPDIKAGILRSGFNMENVYEVNHINEAFSMLNNLCKNDKVNYVLFENDLPDVYM